AILRRTGHVVRNAGTGARRALDWVSLESQDDLPALLPTEPPEAHPRLLDGAEAFPDVVGALSSADRQPLLVDEPEPDFESIENVLERTGEHADYRLPDRDILRRSPETTKSGGDGGARI